MVLAGLITRGFMAAVDVRSMVWPLLIYAFVTTWALLTIGIQFATRNDDESDTY